ncbi:MAG: hypothetical protein JW751_32620 [Polyangiaceae bacterium]|nr:hypothetical protein [Polyangiaceae bacterium]
MYDQIPDRRKATGAMPTVPGSAREFEARLRDLRSGLGERSENVGCIACSDCRGCDDSTFCRRCTRVARCHFCVDCADSTDSAHCQRSNGLVRCQHCLDSERCVTSSYLAHCFGLSESTYCFGCVGLSGADFHILNEPYPRETYFAITRRLRAELAR